jgi:hypothetical protein
MDGATTTLTIPKVPIDPSAIISIIFLVIFVWWLIYTLVAIYHWLRHASESWMAVPAVVIHLFVSGFLIFYATSGLHN